MVAARTRQRRAIPPLDEHLEIGLIIKELLGE
jgi:hypothetical protein